MLQEAPQELGGGERHLPLLVAARVILPAEGDALTVESQQAMIADGNTVGVPAEVAQYLASAAESWLGINDPVLPEQRTEKTQKQLGLFQRRSYVQRDAGRTGEKTPETNRLQEFWEWRLKDSKEAEELKEFGWWVREGKFNAEWMLGRLIETLEKTGGDIEADFHVLSVLLALSAKHPQLCAKALSLIVRASSADRLTLGHDENIPRILAALYSTGDAAAIGLAENIIDHLTKLGFETFRKIPQTERKSLELEDQKF